MTEPAASMYRYCDEALYDQTIQEPDLRGLERLKEDGLYLLGAVMLTVMGAGLLANRGLDLAEDLRASVKRRSARLRRPSR